MQGIEQLLQLAGVAPDRDGLLQWLADEMTLGDVETIAKADAYYNWQDNQRALQRMLDNRQLRAPVDTGDSWLQECCSLTMWAAQDGGLSVDDCRQICCACVCLVLAGAPGAPWQEQVHAMSDPVAAMVTTVRSLGPEARRRGRGLLAHACGQFAAAEQLGEYEDLFCAAGMLVLMDEPTPRLLQALLDLEQAAAAEGYGSKSQHWLFRLTFFNQMQPLWRELLLDLADRVPSSAADTLAANVREWPD